MKESFRDQLEKDFAADSRVWIYQSDLAFSSEQKKEIERLLSQFTVAWKSHGHPVKGAAHLFYDRFIVIMADERATGVSGCSTDSSVRLMKDIEQRFGVNLFERTNLAFQIADQVELVPLAKLQEEVDRGHIGLDTVYFNNLVQTKEELEESWTVPLSKSWLAKRVHQRK